MFLNFSWFKAELKQQFNEVQHQNKKYMQLVSHKFEPIFPTYRNHDVIPYVLRLSMSGNLQPAHSDPYFQHQDCHLVNGKYPKDIPMRIVSSWLILVGTQRRESSTT